MLTLHQLRVFLTVAETGSVRVAAEQLVVTQPAVSASIAALEREIEATLFAKSGRGIELTGAGKVMQRYAGLVLSLVDEAIAAVSGEDDPGRGSIRIGAASSAADHLLAPLLARVHAAHPGLGIQVEVGNRNRVWQLLAERAVDIVLASRPPATGEFLSIASKRNELVLVAKPGTVWAQTIGDATWLMRESGSGTRSAAEEVITQMSISPPTLTVGSNAAILASAEAGLGVALLPREACENSLRLRTLTLVHTPVTPLVRPWHLVVRSNETLPATVQRFVDNLLQDGTGFERVR